MKLNPLVKGSIYASLSVLAVGAMISSSQAFEDQLLDYLGIYDGAEFYQSLTNDLETQLLEFGSDFASVVQIASGDLGLIDPNQALQQIEQYIEDTSDVNASEKIIEIRSKSYQLNRLQNQAVNQSYISEAGQQNTAEKIALSQEMLQQIKEQRSAVDNAISTHEAIKSLGEITAMNASLQTAIYSEQLQNQQAQAVTNLNIADMQGLMSKENRFKQLEAINSSLYYLRSNIESMTLP